MSGDSPLPGAPDHQQLLRMVIAIYANDERVLAVLVFGSLARGNWDAFSDLDLAVILRDDAQIDVKFEVARVQTGIIAAGGSVLFTEVADHEGYLVLGSLTGVAIRYHTLSRTSPFVLEGLCVLSGSLNAESIREAAEANNHPEPALEQQVHRALWLALGAEIALQRGHFWRALPSLERSRGALLEIFASTHGGQRAHQSFEEKATAELKASFGRTLPRYSTGSIDENLDSLQHAIAALLDLMEHHLDDISNRQVQLGPGERKVIRDLRKRQAILKRRR